MRITVEKPNYIRIAYRPDPGDDGYAACTWAYFDFDLDEWLLNIQSDIGDYAHGWPVGKSETFLELCARMDGDYLERKLFHEEYTVFDEDATVANFREYLEEAEYDDDRIGDLLDDLHYKLGDYDLERCVPLAEYLVCEWANENGLSIDCPFDYMATELTAWQKRIVRIFVEHVQPKIREMLKDGGAR